MNSSTTEENSDSDVGKSSGYEYKCTYEGCNAVYKKPSRLLYHLPKHTGERPYKCTVEGCSKDYRNKNHLKRHVIMSHCNGRNVNRVTCPVKDCMREVSNQWNLKRHMNRYHCPERKYPFTCDQCGEGYHKKTQLHKHVYLHTGIKPLQCDICDKRFLTARELNRHKRTHTEYKCDCGEIFERWNCFIKHRKTCQDSGKEVKCNICNINFANQSNLNQHMVVVHEQTEDKNVFVCTYKNCGRYYAYKRNLAFHIDSFHLKIKKKLPCTFEGCKASLNSEAALKKHLEKHKTIKTKKSIRMTRKDKGSTKASTTAKLLAMPLPSREHKLLKSCKVDLSDSNTSSEDEYTSAQDNDFCSEEVFSDVVDSESEEIITKTNCEVNVEENLDIGKTTKRTCTRQQDTLLKNKNEIKNKMNEREAVGLIEKIGNNEFERKSDNLPIVINFETIETKEIQSDSHKTRKNRNSKSQNVGVTNSTNKEVNSSVENKAVETDNIIEEIHNTDNNNVSFDKMGKGHKEVVIEKMGNGEAGPKTIETKEIQSDSYKTRKRRNSSSAKNSKSRNVCVDNDNIIEEIYNSDNDNLSFDNMGEKHEEVIIEKIGNCKSDNLLSYSEIDFQEIQSGSHKSRKRNNSSSSISCEKNRKHRNLCINNTTKKNEVNTLKNKSTENDNINEEIHNLDNENIRFESSMDSNEPSTNIIYNIDEILEKLAESENMELEVEYELEYMDIGENECSIMILNNDEELKEPSKTSDLNTIDKEPDAEQDICTLLDSAIDEIECNKITLSSVVISDIPKVKEDAKRKESLMTDIEIEEFFS